MRPDLIALLLVAAPAAADPTFRPVDMPPHIYSGGWEHFVGGGLAVFDCDGDGLPELFAAGGENPASLMRNRSQPGAAVRFLEGTPESLALTHATGAYPLDIDSDGFLDLVILRVGENVLRQGGPECRFSAFDAVSAPSGDEWTTAFSATWEGSNRLPTLAFGNYVDRGNPDGPFGTCDTNLLFRPADDNYTEPLLLDPGYCALSMLFSDWGRQGRADLRISNDRHYYVTGGSEQLWAMEDVPRLMTESDGWASYQLWGMGIASRDLSGDGYADVFLTSMGDQRLQIQTGAGERPAFDDVPYNKGTTAHRPYTGGDGRPSTGWHVAFGDVQNDGLDDVFIAKGNVEQMPDSAMDDPNNLLLQLPDGTFREAGDMAGVASLHRGRGAALADFNGDGLLDLAVVNRRAPMEVWQNVTSESGHWLSVALNQPAPNRRAVGAWIEVDTPLGIQAREVTIGGGHAGGSALPEHFGLGKSEKVRLRVIWPDRTTSAWIETEADRAVTVVRHADVTELQD